MFKAFSIRVKIVLLVFSVFLSAITILGFQMRTSELIKESVAGRKEISVLISKVNKARAIQIRYLKNGSEAEIKAFKANEKKIREVIDTIDLDEEAATLFTAQIDRFIKDFYLLSKTVSESMIARDSVIEELNSSIGRLDKEVIAAVDRSVTEALMGGGEPDKSEEMLAKASGEFQTALKDLVVNTFTLYATGNSKQVEEKFKDFKDNIYPAKVKIVKSQADSCNDKKFVEVVKTVVYVTDKVLDDIDTMLKKWKKKTEKEKLFEKNFQKLEVSADGLSVSILTTIDNVYSSSKTVLLFVLSLLIAIVLFFAFAVVSSISEPLKKLIATFNEISTGHSDLTKRVDLGGSDELSSLAGNFNEFIGKMELLVKTVKGTVNSVTSASGEVARGNNQLSSVTEKMADSITHSSESIGSITNSLSSVADESLKISDRVEKMSGEAENGAEMLKGMGNAMTSLQQSGAKISEIIDVVNEIAFQTNLLALNAAVEAARAGEMGKGFAVVASEVRALAERSAEAVSQVQLMVDKNKKDIESAGELSGKTTKVLMGVVEKVKSTAFQLRGIEGEIRGHTTSMKEVGHSIDHIESMTSDNSSLVDELSRSAENLGGIAGNLNNQINKFKVSS